jgi:hypothetical protein
MIRVQVTVRGCTRWLDLSKIIHVQRSEGPWFIHDSVGRGLAMPNILTYHYDNARTGWNQSETQLVPASFKCLAFGQLFQQPLDGGAVLAQPLYVQGLQINGVVRNVVYVLTLNGNVYAFDADQANNGQPLWGPVSLLGTGETPNGGAGNAFTSTPVIDNPPTTMYVFGNIINSANQTFFRLHAVNLITGAFRQGDDLVAKASVTTASGQNIILEVPGNGDEQDPNNPGYVYFDPNNQGNRAALLLLGSNIYAPIAGPGDNWPFHGWIFSFDAASLKLTGLPFCTTPDATGPLPGTNTDGETSIESGGSIWQAGFGLAADSAGYLYAATGNGLVDTVRNFGDSIIKLNSSLVIQGAVAAWNHDALAEWDVDLGSGGVVVLPDNTGGGSLIVGCGKDGGVYLQDRTQMMLGQPGNAGNLSNANLVVPPVATLLCVSNPQSEPFQVGGGPGVWGGPAYYGGALGPLIYYCGGAGPLQAFTASLPANNTQLSLGTTPYGVANVTPASEPFWNEGGAIPVVTSNGSLSGTGLVWLVTRADPQGQIHLRAYDAADLTRGNLFDDAVGSFTITGSNAFVVPVAVNSKAYVASDNALSVYGMIGNINRLAAGNGNQGFLQVIFLGDDDGQPYLFWQDSVGNWSDFGPLPNANQTPYSTLAVGAGNAAQLQVIFIGENDGQPYLTYQDPGGNWHNFGMLPNPNGTPYSSVAVGVGNATQLQAIFIGENDGQPYLIYQDPGGNWHNFGVLPNPNGTPYSSVAVGTGNAGQLQAICIGRNDGQPYLIYQDTGGNWHNFGALPNPNGTPYSSVAVGVGNATQLQVIFIGKNDGQPYLIYQDTGGNWHNFGALPNPGGIQYVTLTTGSGNQIQLQVVCIGKADGQPYLIYQDTGGNWHNFGALPNPSYTPPGSTSPTRFASVTTGVGNSRQLQVICGALDNGKLTLIWQDTGGGWHGYAPPRSPAFA